MSEIYIYAATIQNTFVFIHTVHDHEKYTNNPFPIDGQIMNCMIHETMIHNYNQKVLVFTIFPDEKKIVATNITHEKGISVEFSKENLSFIFRICLQSLIEKDDDKAQLIYEFDYDSKIFKTYEFNYIKDKLNTDVLSGNVPIDNIIYMKTTKEI